MENGKQNNLNLLKGNKQQQRHSLPLPLSPQNQQNLQQQLTQQLQQHLHSPHQSPHSQTQNSPHQMYSNQQNLSQQNLQQNQQNLYNTHSQNNSFSNHPPQDFFMQQSQQNMYSDSQYQQNSVNQQNQQNQQKSQNSLIFTQAQPPPFSSENANWTQIAEQLAKLTEVLISLTRHHPPCPPILPSTFIPFCPLPHSPLPSPYIFSYSPVPPIVPSCSF